MRKQSIIFLINVLVLAFLCTTNGFSQRSNLQNVKIRYIHLPLYPLDPTINTYQPILNIVFPDETKEVDQLIKQYLKIPGYQRSDNNPDLRILVSFGDYKIAEKVLHSDDVYNVNAGKNMTGYLYKIKCEYPVNLQVTTLTGEELCNMHIAHDEKNMDFEFGKWEYSKENLDTRYQEEVPQILLEKQKKSITQALRQIRTILNSYYGNAESSERIRIATGKGKKYDYSDLEDAVDLFREGMAGTVDLLSENEKRKETLQQAINIWMKRIEENESTEKKEGTSPEILQMLWYNCAVAYLWQCEFRKAKEALTVASEVNPGKVPNSHSKYMNNLTEFIADMEKRYLANRED